MKNPCNTLYKCVDMENCKECFDIAIYKEHVFRMLKKAIKEKQEKRMVENESKRRPTTVH